MIIPLVRSKRKDDARPSIIAFDFPVVLPGLGEGLDEQSSRLGAAAGAGAAVYRADQIDLVVKLDEVVLFRLRVDIEQAPFVVASRGHEDVERVMHVVVGKLDLLECVPEIVVAVWLMALAR